MDQNKSENAFRDRVRHFAEILNPIFELSSNDIAHLFEFACVLVRSSGMQDSGWDPWYESQAILNDLQGLAGLDLPADKFPEADRTRLRLGLLSYCHVTEMDLPYAVLANLLRLRMGEKYDINPFRSIARRTRKRLIPPSPGMKIQQIIVLSEKAGLAPMGQAIASIYDSGIRNAVYHSDYTLTNRELRLLAGTRFSKSRSVYTPVVDLVELNAVVVDAFAFYRAFFALYERCRKSFGDFRNAFLPYDGHYKGLLEFIFDNEDALAGFRVYWPNESVSEYSRTGEGCKAMNLVFEDDGSVNFMVGLYASRPGTYSPLVEAGDLPIYAVIPGTSARAHWPQDLKVYKIQSNSKLP